MVTCSRDASHRTTITARIVMVGLGPRPAPRFRRLRNLCTWTRPPSRPRLAHDLVNAHPAQLRGQGIRRSGMKPLLTSLVVSVLALSATNARLGSTAAPESPVGLVASHTVNSEMQELAASSSSYVLTAWSELGMHCIDGKDYSIFAVLPPFNTIRATLIRRG